MSTVFLIRHGESQSNAGLATIGPENVMLTPRGREQARDAANVLQSYPSIGLIVTSPYLRARQTAEPTISMPMFHAVAQEEWAVQEFTYLSSMHEEQSTSDDRRPLVDAYWEQCLPLFVDGAGSESFAQFIDRVQQFRMCLLTIEHDTIAVFTHEQFINAVLWLIKRQSVEKSAQAMREFRDFLDQTPIPNGQIIMLDVCDSLDDWSYEMISSCAYSLSGWR